MGGYNLFETYSYEILFLNQAIKVYFIKNLGNLWSGFNIRKTAIIFDSVDFFSQMKKILLGSRVESEIAGHFVSSHIRMMS